MYVEISFLRDISMIRNLIAGMYAALAFSSSSRNHLKILSQHLNESMTSKYVLGLSKWISQNYLIFLPLSKLITKKLYPYIWPCYIIIRVHVITVQPFQIQTGIKTYVLMCYKFISCWNKLIYGTWRSKFFCHWRHLYLVSKRKKDIYTRRTQNPNLTNRMNP